MGSSLAGVRLGPLDDGELHGRQLRLDRRIPVLTLVVRETRRTREERLSLPWIHYRRSVTLRAEPVVDTGDAEGNDGRTGVNLSE